MGARSAVAGKQASRLRLKPRAWAGSVMGTPGCGEASVASAIETFSESRVAASSVVVAGKQASRLRLKQQAGLLFDAERYSCGEASVASGIETKVGCNGRSTRVGLGGSKRRVCD